ncbi:MAG TPA: hypothetical protein PKY64_05865 [Anaerolineaceae bacterium]|nr:hypothetical protein [Anaerolineaceae bacterium]
MNNLNQSKQNSIISFSARLFLFIMLASTLCSCATNVQTQTALPTDAPVESTPIVENLATQKWPSASETEVIIKMPTITLTAEPKMAETPKPTEVNLIQGDIFYDPQSKEDFKNVVLAPSPIDAPYKFAAWHEEYIKQINEKLENYNGPTVELTKSRYNAEYGSMEFESEKWPVVGSYLYKWHGEDVLNKSYIFSKKSGGEDYVLLNTTFIPKSMAEMLLLEFNYDTPKEYLVILYSLSDKTKKRWPNEFLTDFDDTYRLTEEQLDSLFRIFFHKPENGDEELFSQMQFLFIGSK